ncbi:hypothetical protein D9M69_548610 [compost metagenome]
MGCPALTEQQRHKAANAVDNAVEVDVQHALPLRLGDFPAEAGLHHPGIVKQQVDPAEVLDSPVTQALDLFHITDIGDAGNRLHTAGLHFVAQGLQARCIPIRQHQAHAQCRRVFGQATANTTRGPGNHRYRPLFITHRQLLPWVQWRQ